MDVWECFLEKAGLELDSVMLRMVILKALKASEKAWPLGRVPLVQILMRYHEPRFR